MFLLAYRWLSLQSFRAAGCWFICLFTNMSLKDQAGPSQKAAEKRLLCCKHEHEMYSPGQSGKRLLYESHVQCKKLCLVCTCRGIGVQRGLCEGYSHLGLIAVPKHTAGLRERPAVQPTAGPPSAGMSAGACARLCRPPAPAARNCARPAAGSALAPSPRR